MEQQHQPEQQGAAGDRDNWVGAGFNEPDPTTQLSNRTGFGGRLGEVFSFVFRKARQAKGKKQGWGSKGVRVIWGGVMWGKGVGVGKVGVGVRGWGVGVYRHNVSSLLTNRL